MAPSRDTIENALIKAQRALAVVYGSNYPFCNTVKQGLEGVLNQRYGGSLEDFTVKFIRPTVVLLEKLREKGFPIMKNGRVIVHLLAPTNDLENGEMFYQVGHRTPGTLAVKFTKYEGNSVVMQAGTIQENELHIAFTPEYIEKMRNLAKRMGDQLMRVMLSLTENSQGVFTTEKVEVRKVMSDCYPPVMETGMPKWSGPDDRVQVDESTTCCCCADQVVTDDQIALVFGHQAKEHDSKETENLPYPPLTQAVGDAPLAPTTSRNIDHASVNMNPGSSGVTNLQSEEHSRSSSPYPPLVLPADDNASHPVTCPSAAERLSGANVTNSEYPPMVQAVRDNPSQATNIPAAPERSSGTSVANLEYPPMVQAVRDNPLEPATRDTDPERSSGTSVANLEYPPMVQAVRDNPLEPVTRPTAPELSSGASVTNLEYPPMVQAVRDNPLAQAIISAAPGPSSGTSVINSEYPAVGQAVRNNPSQPATRPAAAERLLGTSMRNPQYPSMLKAVKDNPVTSNATSVYNSEYPPMSQSVRDSPFEPAISRATEGHSRITIVRNPDYPPLIEAVRDQPSAAVIERQFDDHSSSDRRDYPAEGHFVSTRSDNPPYPALIPAIGCDSVTPGTVQSVEESSTASAAAGNPAYPPVMQAVKDDPVASVNGHQSQGNLLSSSSPPTTGEPDMLEDDLDLF